MGSSSLRPHGRLRLIVFALIGNVLPVTIAAATERHAHHPVFFAGAIAACVASLVVALVPRRRRLAFWGAAFGLIPALTLMQAYSGGPASGYSVLVIMPMVWFGLEATDVELVAGMLVLAACCALPMVLIGAPAYPRSWGHAALLTLIGIAVAGSLRAVTRELAMVAQRFAHEAVVDDLTGLLNRRGWRYTAPPRAGAGSAQRQPDHARDARPRQLQGAQRRARSRAGRPRPARHRRAHPGDPARRRRRRAARRRRVRRAADELDADRVADRDRPAAGVDAGEREASRLGIAVWDRREELSELLRRSDLALYAAKDAGGGCTSVAPPQLEPLPAVTDDDDDDSEFRERAAAG